MIQSSCFLFWRELKLYIAVEYDIKQNLAKVWEKVNGKRIVNYVHPNNYFYVKDDDGDYLSLYRDRLSKIECKNYFDLLSKTKLYPNKFESDIKPVERLLMDNYLDCELPDLNIMFVDIEVDYNKKIGFAKPTNPYAPINAITLYDVKLKKYYTLAIPSIGFNGEISKEITNKTELHLYDNDADLLKKFYELIQDADVLSGWNSDYFDIPYIVKRTEKVLGKEWAEKIAFPEAEVKYEEMEVQPFKNSKKTALYIKCNSRVFLDYHQLYRKFSFVNLVSYSLASVAEVETKIEKLKYDGTLSDLYNDDFNFFILYNIRDVEVIVEIDRKRKFISLANRMIHKNTVTFDAVFGSVRIIETGIMNELHKQNLIANDKRKVEKRKGKKEKAEGAIVLNPKRGLHRKHGSVDLNSLYPNIMCTNNISPEKMVGQFEDCEQDWEAIVNKSNKLCTLRLVHGEIIETTAKDWHESFTELKWGISAYGTVFDQSTGQGIIPFALSNWYKLRKQWQSKYKELEKQYELTKHTLSEEEKNILLEEIANNDLEQHTMKIFLNSTYGALLNEHFRFGRPELGSSVTGSGRQVTKFMIETIAEYIDNRHTPLVKQTKIIANQIKNIYTIDTNSIIYSDTDSCYFNIPLDDIEDCIKYADSVCAHVNSKFNAFSQKNFLCQDEFLGYIRAGREIVADKGLFIEKKKYISQMVDKEGIRISPDSPKRFKMQGVEIKKTDTPKPIQELITNVVDMIFKDKPYAEIRDYVIDYKRSIKNNDNMLQYGIPKKISEYDEFYKAYLEKNKKKVIHQNVRSAINFNEMLRHLDDTYYNPIGAGDGIRILYLKPNDAGFETIGIPADEEQLPVWFDEYFKIDKKKTLEKLIDDKIEIYFDPIGWDIPTVHQQVCDDLFVY